MDFNPPWQSRWTIGKRLRARASASRMLGAGFSTARRRAFRSSRRWRLLRERRRVRRTPARERGADRFRQRVRGWSIRGAPRRRRHARDAGNRSRISNPDTRVLRNLEQNLQPDLVRRRQLLLVFFGPFRSSACCLGNGYLRGNCRIKVELFSSYVGKRAPNPKTNRPHRC